MHVDIQIREPAVCPQCQRSAQPRELKGIVITFGDDRSVTARFSCRSCGQVFETESLGLPQARGRPVENGDSGELDQQVRLLGTTEGATKFLDRLRRETAEHAEE